jgi:hypothetical protein
MSWFHKICFHKCNLYRYAAASSAATDRDVLATSWRREWEAAKEDHAAELRALRARVAATEVGRVQAELCCPTACESDWFHFKPFPLNINPGL